MSSQSPQPIPLAERSRVRSLLVMLLAALTAPALARAQAPAEQRIVLRGAEATAAVVPYVFAGDLRRLPRAARWQPGDPIKEIPRRGGLPAVDLSQPIPSAQAPEPRRDPLLDLQDNAPAGRDLRAFTTPSLNFSGQGYTGASPPDTVGDVGMNYYIQMVNAYAGTEFTIYHKSDGSIAAGPTALSSIGSGHCENGLGDPIVLYDELAGRWLLSEFSATANRLCVYISQTGDPISGGWYNYAFTTPEFPDYPKFAVWSDAYYVSSNESSPAVYALERTKMLAGQPATTQRFTASSLGGFSFQALLPSDLDGTTPPPAGAPNYFIRHRDDEVHNPGSSNPTQDFLEIWKFHVDFATPAYSTFTGPINVPITEIDSGLCGYDSFNCFPQPGTSTTLDPLREVAMWRLQYRNFGTYETLVGTLVTDVDGSDHGGKRWFELRKSGGSWVLFQEGTYAPDANHRWMGSAAMDQSGNIALGYNVSSAATYPSLRYVGRLASDPAGTMPQGEVTLVSGSGASGTNRYGDYSSLNVDPADGCTFWFTGEYNAGINWSTRIGVFQFDACGESIFADGFESGNTAAWSSAAP